MDKSWMDCSRLSREYDEGVKKFLQFAVENAEDPCSIRCPCIGCGNMSFQSIKNVSAHLFFNGIDVDYKIWFWHGEKCRLSPPRIDDYFVTQSMEYDDSRNVDMVTDAYKASGDEQAFKEILEQAEKPLYSGCTKFTKLSALVKLFNIKGKFGLSDTSFTELLGLISEILPDNNEMVVSMYDAKKTLSALGLEYIKIHACPNDCVLYRKEFEKLSSCPTCGASRWKKKESNKDEYRVGVPEKVLWYFPIIPRFRRMFQSSETAKDLTWHANGRVSDGKLRHPADSEAWETIDKKWPMFASEPRNLRLALSADGINPHSSLSSTYSCWPVLLVTYNLPPWLCMKRKFMMLSLLISGPHQPGNDIDVYLAPLVEDLQLLWEKGVDCFDSYKKESFNLRAILMWTINDFPAYGNLVGCTVKGYNACPYYGVDTPRTWLKHSQKCAYMGHRRWLPIGHGFRKQKSSFPDNKTEEGAAPKHLNAEEILELVEPIDNQWGKGIKVKGKNVGSDEKVWWKKKSIFYNLEYWKHLLVRHQLDVMHIEKNVCESIYGTLLHMPGKSKDGLKSREDLVHMKIRGKLAPQVKKGKRTWLPPACYTLSKEEKKNFCKSLKSIKVPTGYSSNIRNLVSLKQLKLQGLKSHDCHVLMQQLLPIVVRCVNNKHVKEAIIRLCLFFNALCSKVIDKTTLDKLEKDIVVTLCLLEKCFPPSFFDIMVHLTVHLVSEVRQCGPVYLRWMYPFERYMKILKGYVRNRNRPEGCIAESYIAEEALEFCSEYMSNMKTVGVPEGCVQKLSVDEPSGGVELIEPEKKQLDQAHLWILENSEEIQPFICEHIDLLRFQTPNRTERWYKNEHNKQFSEWLRDKVFDLIDQGNDVSENLRWLSNGPAPYVNKYSAYDINGFHFKTKERDCSRATQNSGVTLIASTMQVASAKDLNPYTDDMAYYGIVDEIWDIDYYTFRVAVFRCDWVDTTGGLISKDSSGFTLVDLKRLGHRSEPFILASQARQVFYVSDPSNQKWSVVCQMATHGSLDDEKDALMEYPPIATELPNSTELPTYFDDQNVIYTGDGVEGIWV